VWVLLQQLVHVKGTDAQHALQVHLQVKPSAAVRLIQSAQQRSNVAASSPEHWCTRRCPPSG
jgi:hypothetical protein